MTASPVHIHPGVGEALARPFGETHTDVRGGVELTYITGEQVISRLLEVLGVGGFQFHIIRHEIDKEADEAYVLGELQARIDGEWVTMQQFGSQKIRRSRATGAPLDLGFDLKGASTDALKKAATLLGVGLYLSHKEPVSPARAPVRPAPQRQQQSGPPRRAAGPPAGSPAPTPADRRPPSLIASANVARHAGGALTCRECDQLIEPATIAGRKLDTAAKLANEGQRLHRRPLCAQCLVQAGIDWP